MIRPLVIALVFIALLSPQTSAQVFDNYITRIDVDRLGDADVNMLVSFDSTSISEIRLPVDGPRDIRVFDANSQLGYRVEGNTAIVQVGERRPNYGMTLEYSTSSLTSKSGDTWTLKYAFASFEKADAAEVHLSLPAEAAVLSARPSAAIYAAENIIVEWDVQNPSSGFRQDMLATYRLGQGQSKDAGIDPLAAAVVILAAVAVFALLIRKKATQSQRNGREAGRPEQLPPKPGAMSEAQKDIMKTLSDREKAVVETIFSSDGHHLTQKKIAISTGIPKSTLSRTIKSLQRKDLIEVYDIGLANSVKLKKWFFEKQ
ncbi:MAG: hypothetical protein HY518_01750 [Candidatus Aenigmarchaeota archaeon]|nr:hypothetical protein [Candidatus Aenigmarchaeota archaeon]